MDWAALELRHLMTLKAVAEEGSFAAAAERLGYTQPAISQQIAVLEKIVGRRLLERPPGRRPVGLTPSGELFMRYADAIIADVKAAQADLAALADGTTAPLRIGSFQSVGTHILPKVLTEMRLACPEVPLRLREAVGDIELLEHVAEGELDLTFVVLPVPPGPFESVELLQDPFVVVVPADTELTAPLSPKDVVGLPLISFQTCDSYKKVEDHLRTQGLRPSTVFYSDDNTTIQALVVAGVGAGLVPRLAVDVADVRTAVLGIDPPLPPRLLGLAWHRDRRPRLAGRTFVETARKVCAGMVGLP